MILLSISVHTPIVNVALPLIARKKSAILCKEDHGPYLEHLDITSLHVAESEEFVGLRE